MELRTTTVDGKLVDVISEEEYANKWRMYVENPTMYSSASMEVQDKDGNSFILPFRGKSDDRPGIYPDGSIYFIKTPDSNIEESEYNKQNLNIVDFSDTTNVKDFLNKNAQIRDMETNVLTDIDSVFTPPLLADDSPEMRAFKEAITSKKIDISKYSQRFGDNFLNDKRILKTNSITMNKLISMSKKLDIEVELRLRNTNPDVANPMGKEITVILTGGEENGSI